MPLPYKASKTKADEDLSALLFMLMQRAKESKLKMLQSPQNQQQSQGPNLGFLKLLKPAASTTVPAEPSSLAQGPHWWNFAEGTPVGTLPQISGPATAETSAGVGGPHWWDFAGAESIGGAGSASSAGGAEGSGTTAVGAGGAGLGSWLAFLSPLLVTLPAFKGGEGKGRSPFLKWLGDWLDTKGGPFG